MALFQRGFRIPAFNARQPRSAAHKGRFVMQTIANIETVKARLAQAGEDIEAAQQELQRVSLDAALSDDPVAAARAAVDRLAEARSRQEILSAALASAMAAETDRLNGLTEREDKAR